MSIFDIVNEWWKVKRFRNGSLPRQELFNDLMPARKALLRDVPIEERGYLESTFNSLDSMANIKDFSSFIDISMDLSRQLHHIIETYKSDELGETILEKSGYFNEMPTSISLQGGNAYNFFLNPFGPYTFFADNHWAVSSAIEFIERELLHQGFSLLPKNPSKVSQSRSIEATMLVKQFGIEKLLMQMIRFSLAYRNVLVMPHITPLRSLMRFEVLRMDRVMPCFDLKTEQLVGWDYYINHTTRFIPKDQLIHLHKPSYKHPDIGIPTAAPIALDLEADFGASSLNLASVTRCGAIGVIIATRNDSRLGGKQNARLARRLEAEIQNSHSGYLNPHSVIASNIIENVHKISKAGDLDASFLNLRYEIVGKGTATCFGIPANALNVSAKSSGVYESKGLSDKDRDKVNKTCSSVATPALDIINNVILPNYLNLNDFYMVANGKTLSSTLDGAQISYAAARSGALFTKNEHRVWFFGAPAVSPEDPTGNQYVDNSLNRDPKSTELDQAIFGMGSTHPQSGQTNTEEETE